MDLLLGLENLITQTLSLFPPHTANSLMLLASALCENKPQLRCLQKTRCQIGILKSHTSHQETFSSHLLSSSFNWIWRRSVHHSSNRLKQSGVLQAALVCRCLFTGRTGADLWRDGARVAIYPPLQNPSWSLCSPPRWDLQYTSTGMSLLLLLLPQPVFLLNQALFYITSSPCFSLPSGCHRAFLCVCCWISQMELAFSLANGKKNEHASCSHRVPMCFTTFWLENKTLLPLEHSHICFTHKV